MISSYPEEVLRYLQNGCEPQALSLLEDRQEITPMELAVLPGILPFLDFFTQVPRFRLTDHEILATYRAREAIEESLDDDLKVFVRHFCKLPFEARNLVMLAYIVRPNPLVDEPNRRRGSERVFLNGVRARFSQIGGQPSQSAGQRIGFSMRDLPVLDATPLTLGIETVNRSFNPDPRATFGQTHHSSSRFEHRPMRHSFFETHVANMTEDMIASLNENRARAAVPEPRREDPIDHNSLPSPLFREPHHEDTEVRQPWREDPIDPINDPSLFVRGSRHDDLIDRLVRRTEVRPQRVYRSNRLVGRTEVRNPQIEDLIRRTNQNCHMAADEPPIHTSQNSYFARQFLGTDFVPSSLQASMTGISPVQLDTMNATQWERIMNGSDESDSDSEFNPEEQLMPRFQRSGSTSVGRPLDRSTVKLPSNIDASSYMQKLDQLYAYLGNIQIHHGIKLCLARHAILESAMMVILKAPTGHLLSTGLRFKFDDEPAVDLGGVKREAFTLIAKELFDPRRGYFGLSAAGNYRLQVNPISHHSEGEWAIYRLAGRFLAMAIANRQAIGFRFSSAFLKALLGYPTDIEDLKDIDMDIYKNVKTFTKIDDPEDLDLYFSVTREDLDVTVTEDLIEGGSNIQVTSENRDQYIKLLINHHTNKTVSRQMELVCKGFHELISQSTISILDWPELDVLISGTTEIDVNDWKAHTKYENCNAKNPVIVRFWKFVEEKLSNQQRLDLLQFTTGSAVLPATGFASLQDSNGSVRPFTIKLMPSSSSPVISAHTCFNQICIPEHESDEKFEEYMLEALAGKESFHLV